MGRTFRTITGKAGMAGLSRPWKWFAQFAGRPPLANVDRLNARMLRDIGLDDTKASELRKIERLRRP
jgi:hypothetical protein